MSWFVVEAQVCKSHGPIHMTLDERIAPLIPLSSKRWWHWKIRHVWSENRRCLAVLISRLKLQAHFSAFKQPKRRIKMAALMLPSPTEATIERKTTLVRTDAFPWTTEDHKLFRKIWIHASWQIVINTDAVEETEKSRMEKRSLGHWHLLQSQHLPFNFELETDKAAVTRYPISFEFSTSPVLYSR